MVSRSGTFAQMSDLGYILETDRLQLPPYQVLCRPGNVPTCRVAEKIGMTVWKETEFHGFLHRVYSIERPLPVAPGPPPVRYDPRITSL
jgi:hypothetical protein